MKRKYGIGYISTNNSEDVYTIVKRVNNKVWVEFREFKCVIEINVSALSSGSFRNPMRPSVHGIGYLGIDPTVRTSVKGKSTRCYMVWKNMLDRCYKESHKYYKSYGKVGVKVCEEWHSYSNFSKWYSENYVEEFELDKDIVGCGMEYSPSKCIFVSKSENSSFSNSKKDMSYKNNPTSKDISHYENVFTTRANFMRICENRGLNFNDFAITGKKIVKASTKYTYKRVFG